MAEDPEAWPRSLCHVSERPWVKVPSVGCCRCQDSEISVRSKGTSGPGSGLRQAVRAGGGAELGKHSWLSKPCQARRPFSEWVPDVGHWATEFDLHCWIFWFHLIGFLCQGSSLWNNKAWNLVLFHRSPLKRLWALKKSGTFKGFEFLKTGTFISWTVFYITILTWDLGGQEVEGYGSKVVCLWVKLTRDKASYLALTVNLIQPITVNLIKPTASSERSLSGGAT